MPLWLKVSLTLKGVVIFHAGTKLDGGELRTAGGRIFAVTATGRTLEDTVQLACAGVNCVKFDIMFYRKDIAKRYVLLDQRSSRKKPLTKILELLWPPMPPNGDIINHYIPGCAPLMC